MFSDFYDVSARVFCAGKPIQIKIKGRDPLTHLPSAVKDEVMYLVLTPLDGIFPEGELHHRKVIYKKYPASICQDDPECVTFSIDAMPEGEYTCSLGAVQEAGIDSAIKELICQFNIYVLEEDLFKLVPLKGDMHVHSNYSRCSSKENSPRLIAAYARERGMDYIALTDHLQMQSSAELADFGNEFGSEFQVFKGEECHILLKKEKSIFRCWNMFGHVHIVNFGGSESICKYFNDHYDEVHAEISDRANKIDLPYSFEVRYIMAGSDWFCDKIHEYGGLAFFCHPCWMADNMFNLPVPVRDYMLKQKKYDAMEVVGMATANPNYPYSEANDLGAALWHEECIKANRMIPVVGNSDSHNNAHLSLGTKFTVVFAENNSLEALQTAIRKGNCVAVMNPFDNGSAPKILGSFRLVKYAHFLIRNFYPEHDELCSAEGRNMLRSIRENIDPAAFRPLNKKTVSNYIKRFFNN